MKCSEVPPNAIRAIRTEKGQRTTVWIACTEREKKENGQNYGRSHVSFRCHNAHMIQLKHARFVASHTKCWVSILLPLKIAEDDADAGTHIHSFRDGAANGCNGMMLVEDWDVRKEVACHKLLGHKFRPRHSRPQQVAGNAL